MGWPLLARHVLVAAPQECQALLQGFHLSAPLQPTPDPMARWGSWMVHVPCLVEPVLPLRRLAEKAHAWQPATSRDELPQEGRRLLAHVHLVQLLRG
eukprot:11297552-Alexandrium_andersonii.AAC.1